MKKTNKKHLLGRFGELCAVIYLKITLYKIIATRFKSKNGEIDIIASKKDVIAFIEVKLRQNKNQLPTAIDYKKMQKINHTAQLFLLKNPAYQNYKLRFDIVFISKSLMPVHIKNAWQK